MKIFKYAIAALLLVGQVSCIDKKFEEEFKISVTPDAILSKVTIEVNNADGDETTVPEAEISFSGEGSENIYTPAGKKDFKTLDGTLTFGITRDVSPTPEEPALVFMTIEAPGYETITEEVTFDGTDDSSIQVYSLKKTGTLPTGSSLETTTENLGANGETTSTIEVSIEANVEEPVEVEIAENTTFEDEDGNQITGSDVQVDLQTFSTNVDLETATFDNPEQNPLTGVPDGGFVLEDGTGLIEPGNPPTEENAARVPLANNNDNYLGQNSVERNLNFFPLGNPSCYYLYVNGRRVYRFSREIKVRTYLYNRNVVNPIANRPVIAGDVLQVYRRVVRYKWRRYYSWWSRRYYWYSYRYYSYVKSNKTGIIKSEGGRLYAEYPTNYGGVHYFGFTGENVSACNVDDLQPIQFENSGRPTYYYFSITDVNNRYVGGIGLRINKHLTVSSGALKYNRYFRHLKKLAGTGYKLKIYGYNRTTHRYEVVYNKETSLCDLSGKTLDLTTSECYFDYNLEMKVDCPDVSIVFNNTPIYYREQGKRWFRYYNRINRGKITGPAVCLDDNTNYEFRLSYDGEWYKSAPISGKEVKEVSIDFNTDKVCDIIEDSL